MAHSSGGRALLCDQLRTRGSAAALLAALTVLHPIHATASDTTTSDILARVTPPDGQLDPVLSALAAGRITTHIPPLAAGQIAPDPVVNGYVLLGSDLDGFDITHTPQGQAEIAAFVDRLRARGEAAAVDAFLVFSLPDVKGEIDRGSGSIDPNDVPIDAGAVNALTDGDGGPLSSAVVVPACAPRPELVGAVLSAAGELMVKTTIQTAANVGTMNVPCDIPQPTRSVNSANDPTYDSDAWTPAGGFCWERKQNNTAWFDPCHKWFHRTDDGNPYRSTYALTQYGTGKSKGIYELDELEVQSWRKTGTPDQDWEDWSPRSDMEVGHCETKTVGVNVAAAYIEKSATLCETWDIHKGEDPADFATRWRGDVSRSERETAMFIATSVPNGYAPHDIVDYDYYAWS